MLQGTIYWSTKLVTVKNCLAWSLGQCSLQVFVPFVSSLTWYIPSGSEMDIEIIQMAIIISMHTHVFIRGLKGYTMTKYLSTAIAVEVRVETNTHMHNDIGTMWHRPSPNTHEFMKYDRGVKGTASKHIMMSEIARFVINMFVMVCIALLRITIYTTNEFPLKPMKNKTT